MSALSEFDIIQRYFSDIAPNTHSSILLGVGDDAAIIKVPENHELVFSIDTQIEGTHFPTHTNPEWIAQRAFRCAVSDLAAMGAQPLCFTLALTLPTADEVWLQGFSKGLKQVAREFNCSLVGGDTTKGPLSITLQVHGTVPEQTALKRSAALINDIIFVSGYLGNSAAYVQLMHENRLTEKSSAHARELFSHDYFFPTPQLTLGKALRQYAHAAIDVSDGLLADLGHICKASRLSAELQVNKLPLIPELTTTFGAETALLLALTGGDDYQLCFTAPENKCRKIISLCEDMECAITAIGRITASTKNHPCSVTCYDANGQIFDIPKPTSHGYSHF